MPDAHDLVLDLLAHTDVWVGECELYLYLLLSGAATTGDDHCEGVDIWTTRKSERNTARDVDEALVYLVTHLARQVHEEGLVVGLDGGHLRDLPKVRGVGVDKLRGCSSGGI